MSGLVPSSGEGEKTILGRFTKEARPNPFSPRLRYLFEHLDMKKINAVLTRKDITGKEMNKLLGEELDACAPPSPEFDRFMRADVEEEDMYMDDEEEEVEEGDEEDMDEDNEDEGRDEIEAEGEMRKTLQLGDQEKHGIMKRPQQSLVPSELECKKPRVAEGFGFQEGEPVDAEI